MQSGERSKHEEAFESAPASLLMIDRNGRVALANRRAEATFGYSRHELVGQPLASLLPSGSSGTGAALPAGDAVTRPVELVARRKGGAEFTAEVAACDAPDGGTVLAVRDLSEVKREEAALRAQGAATGPRG